MTAKRTKLIGIKVTEKEYSEIESKAVSAKLRISAYGRAAMLNAKIRESPISEETAKTIALNLGRIGSNINQIARKCNMGDKVRLEEIRTLRKALEGIWGVVFEGKPVPDRTKAVGEAGCKGNIRVAEHKENAACGISSGGVAVPPTAPSQSATVGDVGDAEMSEKTPYIPPSQSACGKVVAASTSQAGKDKAKERFKERYRSLFGTSDEDLERDWQEMPEEKKQEWMEEWQ